jgi:hypothetical protein
MKGNYVALLISISCVELRHLLYTKCTAYTNTQFITSIYRPASEMKRCRLGRPVGKRPVSWTSWEICMPAKQTASRQTYWPIPCSIYRFIYCLYNSIISCTLRDACIVKRRAPKTTVYRLEYVVLNKHVNYQWKWQFCGGLTSVSQSNDHHMQTPNVLQQTCTSSSKIATVDRQLII